eukprot:UN27223
MQKLTKPLSIQSLHHKISKYQNVYYFNDRENITSDTIQHQLKQDGYCLFRNTNLHDDIMNEDEKISHPTIEIIQKAIFGVDKKQKRLKL